MSTIDGSKTNETPEERERRLRLTPDWDKPLKVAKPAKASPEKAKK